MPTEAAVGGPPTRSPHWHLAAGTSSEAAVSLVAGFAREPRRSGDQLLSQSLCNRVSPVANAELALDFLEMTAHGLLAETEHLGNLLGSPSHRHKA